MAFQKIREILERKKHAFVNYQKYSSLFSLGTLIPKTRMTTSTEAQLKSSLKALKIKPHSPPITGIFTPATIRNGILIKV